ncbi:MAG TPA: biotin carboxylase N-terminal domain-containing protein, partial [Thermodesulfobacteriota bacterium]|nr:biotin carboxylase N-terminal domain-containing protein [Thermodesulfobacteriota bacterium]
LDIPTLITAALGTGAQAIHPGYGFLAEQARFPEACKENGLIFIGPTAENMRQMGDKLMARKIAKESGVPTTPGSILVSTCDEALQTARGIGYPLLIKASAGGGGRGIKIVTSDQEMATAFETASAEAREAFGDERLYIEKFIANARHIEVQVIADRYGNTIHLGERDCSLQRRHQKLLEETPSPVLDEKLREEICNAAVAVAKHINYENCGTVEFLFDQDQRSIYFLEMNTRIQVEHPITEMVTGVDLVQEGIKVADGAPLSLTQADIKNRGHAIECRINAEIPEEGFRPNPGRITRWNPPRCQGIRLDSHCYSGYLVPPYYDYLIAKLITYGTDRGEAIKLMRYALANFKVSGIGTTIPFFKSLLENPDFLEDRYNTKWVEEVFFRNGGEGL